MAHHSSFDRPGGAPCRPDQWRPPRRRPRWRPLSVQAAICPFPATRPGIRLILLWFDRANVVHDCYLGRRGKTRRGNLACWIYGEMNHARNDYLHGNELSEDRLTIKSSGRNLFQFAPSLYRLLLTGYLGGRLGRRLRSPQRCFFARRFKHALDVTVQCSHDADPRKRALIRPFEVAWDAPVNGPMETNMTAAMFDAQGPGIAHRIKTCARASTPKKARPGE